MDDWKHDTGIRKIAHHIKEGGNMRVSCFHKNPSYYLTI